MVSFLFVQIEIEMVIELCFSLEVTFPLRLFLRTEYSERFQDELSFRKKDQNCSYNPEHSNIATHMNCLSRSTGIYRNIKDQFCLVILNHAQLQKKRSFPLRISSVNVTKTAENFRFGHTCSQNPQLKTKCFVACMKGSLMIKFFETYKFCNLIK